VCGKGIFKTGIIHLQNFLPMRQLSKTVRAMLLCCSFFTQIHVSLTQTPVFIRASVPNEITLTAPEDSIYQYQSTSVYNNATTIVHFEDIRDHISNNLLSFQIPGTYTNLIVEPREVESTDTVHYTWSGIANESGFFSITNRENLYAGFIQTDSGAWTILPLREHYSLLLRHDVSVLDTVDCVMEEGESAAEPPDYCSEAYNICPAVIDVLLFFTSEAVAMVTRYADANMKALTMDGFVKTLENSVNFAFENSDIPNKRVRFRWIIHNPGYSSTTNIDYLLDQFVSDSYVSSALSSYRADLGIFVTAINFSNAARKSNIKLLDYPSSSHRHSVVSFQAMHTPRWTLPHELTHLLGAGHNWCNNVPCSNCDCNNYDYCNHGYRFYAGGLERRTIHALGNERILHFSNPNVDYLGEPTGVFGDYPAYNAQIIRNTGCVVAAYSSSPEVKAMISGPSKLCGITGEFSSTIFYASILPPAQGLPGQAPYTVSWWWNETGVFTYQAPDEFLGTGNQITLTDVPACNYFTLHIRVRSDDGIYFTASKIIFTGLCEECQEERIVKTNNPLLSSSRQQSIKFFPNPTSGQFIAEFHVEGEPDDAMIFISSMDGKMQYDFGRHLISRGVNRIALDLSNLPNGFYNMHLISAKRKLTALITLQKNKP